MKRLFIFVFAAIACLHAAAQTSFVATHAHDAFVSTLKQETKSLLERKLNRTLSLSQMEEVSLSATDVPLKAINIEGGGFALLRYDGSKPTLIGYSDKGSFSEDRLPEPMREWMDAMSSPTFTSVSKAPFVYTYTPVTPLLITKWGQREPFNSQCPTYNNEPTTAGCTAVALAQVLYYYRSDKTASVVEEYVNKATNTEISVDYSKGRYDWDNMLSSYEEGTYTSQQADAVAHLMFEAGVACHCQYDQYSTTGYDPFVALQRHYNFDCNFYYRNCVTTEMWMETIQRNLLEGNPVIYSGGGGGSGQYGVTGHCFIVDGIDADGLCHVNWGWNGLDDGYYDIALANPPSSSSSYVSRQQIITDIKPRKSSEQYQEQLVQAGTIVGRDYSAVTSNSYDRLDYRFGVGFIPVDNDIAVETLESVSWYNPYSLAYPAIMVKGSNGAVVSDGGLSTNMPDGHYKQCLVYGETDDRSSWHIASWPEEFMSTIEVQNHQFVNNNRRDTVYLHQLETVSDACNGSYFYLMLDMELDKEDGIMGNNGRITLPNMTFENLETHNIYVAYGGGVNTKLPPSYPNVRTKAVYCVKPTNPTNDFTMPSGSYRFVFGDSGSTPWANATDEDLLITITDKPAYPLLDVSTSNFYFYTESYNKEIKVLQKDEYKDSDIPAFYPTELYSANNVGGKVVVNIYAKREGEDEEVFVCSIPDFEVNANSKNSTSYELPVKLFPLWGAYRFSFRYLTPDGERTLLNPLAEGQHVFILQTNDNFPYLQAISQLSVSPSASQHPSSAARLSDSGNVMSMQVRNRGSKQFEGVVVATFVDTKTGTFLKSESQPVSIDSGQEAEVVFPMILPDERTYDVYFDGLGQGQTKGVAILDYSLQQREHQTLNVGTDGIVPAIQQRTETSSIYDLQGRKISHKGKTNKLSRGIYIVDGKKIVIR